MIKKILRVILPAFAMILAFGLTVSASPGKSFFSKAFPNGDPVRTGTGFYGYFFEAKSDAVITALGRPAEGMKDSHSHITGCV